MSIRSAIDPGRVLCNVEARSKKHSLDIVSELLAGCDPELSHDTIFDCMIKRERLGCTAIGSGVAIPHGCAEGIDKVCGAFVRLRKPVDYDTPDNAPVDLIFGLLVPNTDPHSHGPELEQIAAAFQDKELRRALRAVTSSHDLYDELVRFEPQPPSDD
ncbi:MAG: PTS sugar transporter subunit IIA [Gammaproteobacteria bacterium]